MYVDKNKSYLGLMNATETESQLTVVKLSIAFLYSPCLYKESASAL